MSEYSEMAHKHLANAPGSAVNDSYPVYQPQPVPMQPHPVRFQELPRLQVPPFALTPQPTPAWKLPQEQPAPRMSVSNLLSGSFRSRSAPQPPQQAPLLTPPSPPAAPAPAPRRLPSFADILARTNLLHLVGRSSEPVEAPAPAMEAPMEEEMQMQHPQPEQMMAPVYQQPQPMMQPMEGSYTAYAPPRVDTNVSMETTRAKPTSGASAGRRTSTRASWRA
ncbi:early-phytochrome-responsive1 family protein [Phytophthora cinnamomi]|uniref:early-phytochrome-responsive1 family protein n=1 Tax=Phytophthora cinnamomi TaxID=4785 RepID=UPI003559A127|nr:early-phytochrome-responsive1 family protein [Phytophthora cinnamomi]